jgi:hypothetical protein
VRCVRQRKCPDSRTDGSMQRPSRIFQRESMKSGRPRECLETQRHRVADADAALSSDHGEDEREGDAQCEGSEQDASSDACLRIMISVLRPNRRTADVAVSRLGPFKVSNR